DAANPPPNGPHLSAGRTRPSSLPAPATGASRRSPVPGPSGRYDGCTPSRRTDTVRRTWPDSRMSRPGLAPARLASAPTTAVGGPIPGGSERARRAGGPARRERSRGTTCQPRRRRVLLAQLPIPMSHPARGGHDIGGRGEGVDRPPAGRGTARAPAEPAAVGPHHQVDPDRHQRQPEPLVNVGGHAVLLTLPAHSHGTLNSGEGLGTTTRHEPIRAHDATALRPEPEHSKHVTVDS